MYGSPAAMVSGDHWDGVFQQRMMHGRVALHVNRERIRTIGHTSLH